MLGGILLILLTGVLGYSFINRLKRKHAFVNKRILTRLFYYHLLLATVYYVYALFNPSDSNAYYYKVQIFLRGTDWFDFYGTSTVFIEFLAYPLVHYFFFTYEACMVLFSFFGFLGFCFFYLFFEENITFRPKILKFDAIYFFLFLPNAHFWSASLGKGSIIFLGMGLYFWSLGKLGQRKLALLMGLAIIYHVRPHILLIVLIATLLAFLLSSKGVSPVYRLLSLLVGVIILVNIFSNVVQMVGLEEDITDVTSLSARAFELTKATSGIDISNYNFFEKLFTFIFRPLFFDAPGVLGLIISVENLVYVILALTLFDFKIFEFFRKGPFFVLAALFAFITVSIALAQITGNLGLAIRQKSQVIFLFFFVILKFMEYKKILLYRNQQKIVRKT